MTADFWRSPLIFKGLFDPARKMRFELVEQQMQFSRRLAPPVFGPAHAVGHQFQHAASDVTGDTNRKSQPFAQTRDLAEQALGERSCGFEEAR
ncbi:MAG: hypothetical protein ACRED1_02750 [Limisphaerales bacterium]